MTKTLTYTALATACLSASLSAQTYQYDAKDAAKYATKYAKTPYSKNLFDSYSFDLGRGGNCTNFISQCLVAGLSGSTSNSGVYYASGYFEADRSFYRRYGYGYAWYYRNSSDRGPAWTGANELYKYAKFNRNDYKGLHFDYITSDSPTHWMSYTKVKVGDIIFADWESDGKVDHSMIVTKVQTWRWGYDEIRVSYQDSNQVNKGLGDINKANKYQTSFHVFRPTFYSEQGK